MVKDFHISKFFQSLVASGGQLNRADLAVEVFNRNWNAKQLDELLSAPQLAGLVTLSKERIRPGRVACRYILTPAGWQIARTWQLPVKVDRIAPEEVQHQFGLLVADGNPWAAGLDRDARTWRTHQQAQERARKEKADALEAKKKQEQADRVKYPSKARHRSEKDIADRKAWMSAKIRKNEAEDRDAQTTSRARAPLHPSTPSTVPVRPTNEWGGAARTGGFTPPSTMRPAAPTATPYLDGQTLALIRKITAAGYRTREDGKVLYNNTEWLTPQEWVKRMGPGIID